MLSSDRRYCPPCNSCDGSALIHYDGLALQAWGITSVDEEWCTSCSESQQRNAPAIGVSPERDTPTGLPSSLADAAVCRSLAGPCPHRQACSHVQEWLNGADLGFSWLCDEIPPSQRKNVFESKPRGLDANLPCARVPPFEALALVAHCSLIFLPLFGY